MVWRRSGVCTGTVQRIAVDEGGPLKMILRAGGFVLACCTVLFCPTALLAQTTVFWQAGFPTVASQPIGQDALARALQGLQPSFVDLAALKAPGALGKTELLVLPYGSAVPTDAWREIDAYLEHGGNLLVLGGQALRVPVSQAGDGFVAGRPQDTYSRAIDLRHTYAVPVTEEARFMWRTGYAFGTVPKVRAERFFAMEGRLKGLGYMVDAQGTRVAAPVIVLDHTVRGGAMYGSRIVALDFQPAAGYWASEDGTALVREAADYARQCATTLSVETLFSVIRPTELPQITVHLRRTHGEGDASAQGEVRVELVSDGKTVSAATLPVEEKAADLSVPFNKPLRAGFYGVRATYVEGKKLRECYENGFWVADGKAVDEGETLGVRGDFLTLGGRPYLPVGTNYFTTEEDGWDFSSPRNAAVWERDFSEMADHGVSLVRTGVWMRNATFIEPDTGGPNERFLRNLEAFLLCAHRHGIAVNFTLFAFSPFAGAEPRPTDPATVARNPYIDKDAVRLEQDYVRGVVGRFAKVPWLSWDLINEPSFSNPRLIFKGNVPNGDPAEVSAWREWLRGRYGNIGALAAAWSVTPEQAGSFEDMALPSAADLTYGRYGNPRLVRAIDYNLFAQDSFSRWVRSMVAAVRQTGSTQLIDVGQDEGGVTDRVLNQFYSTAGASFTTNHTYWQDDALLWDSVAAKRPGMPNITGETGYQPAWAPDGTWRYDEFTGLPLTERKWALGFAAGSSGAMQWDWAREVDFGMQRSDGSAKVWEGMMRGVGAFARSAASYAMGIVQPEIAIVLPQSLQLSVLNRFAVEAQQSAVRALYYDARAEAYAVGEYQIDTLGSPKLILLPSPFALTEGAWQALLAKVREGATLLVTGPFDEDAHLHPTGRQNGVGLPYADVPLTIRRNAFLWPGGEEEFTFAGDKTTVLGRAQLPDGADWSEARVGKGRILFAALPIELSEEMEAIGDVYRYAMKVAKVAPTYTTTLKDRGILICPTRLPQATLYVLTSESNRRAVFFRDARSGREFSGELEPGRAALLLIRTDGTVAASYHWAGSR